MIRRESNDKTPPWKPMAALVCRDARKVGQKLVKNWSKIGQSQSVRMGLFRPSESAERYFVLLLDSIVYVCYTIHVDERHQRTEAPTERRGTTQKGTTMETLSIEALKAAGGQEWRAGSEHRIYFHNLRDLIGIGAEPTDLQKRTLLYFCSTKVWYNVISGKFEYKSNSGFTGIQMTPIVDEIKRRAAAFAETAPDLADAEAPTTAPTTRRDGAYLCLDCGRTHSSRVCPFCDSDEKIYNTKK